MERCPGDITIYHFPVRSASQFRRKVVQGGASYARNTELPETQGWHWRRWYQLITEGRKAEALPDKGRLAEDLKAGTVVHDTTAQTFFDVATGLPSIKSTANRFA
ncbi:hypothetical protein [Breoghania sp.]|uniref:hypothetical protein n=1 Tax=Breoghania sp. TaxID=2065378 RepID=UPI00262A81D2|nr:hypothetical protein [Breoghania sp.]MDJ0933172.1 hypothetical protein [Breoghania sp.]